MDPLDILTFDTPSLGDRSYVATDGDVAVVVDPQRDWEPIAEAADERGLTITHVLETHVHNDYVTGGLVLSRETGADYVVAAADPVGYERLGAVDGMHLEAGALTVEVIGTPGHTPNHLAYVLGVDGDPAAVFTGGSMLFGATGRTDLTAGELTERLTHDQHRSIRRLAGALADHVEVCPTHGFGSFCAAGEVSDAGRSTIGDERRQNPALTSGREEFVRRTIADYDVFPSYYRYVAPINRAGPGPVDRTPPQRVDPEEVRDRVREGYGWVVDLRDRREYAASHLRGTVGMEANDLFATYYGWIAPWGAPLTIITAEPEQADRIQLDLARIGVERPAGVLVGEPDWSGGEVSSYGVVDFAGVARTLRDRDVTILDVRRDLEWEESHMDGAVHIPLHELEVRLDELPDDEIWVHCAGGYRASIATSLLDRAGGRPVLIDDSWETALGRGDLPVVRRGR